MGKITWFATIGKMVIRISRCLYHAYPEQPSVVENVYRFQRKGPEHLEKVNNSSPKKLSANSWPTVGRLSFTAFYKNLLPTVGRLLAVCRPTVGRLSLNCRPTVGSMSVICWPSVGWEPLSNTRKASARREEHCISTWNETLSLESAILFRFFREQAPRNLLCLRFFRYQTPHNPIASSSQSRSKKFVYSGFLQLFFALLFLLYIIS